MVPPQPHKEGESLLRFLKTALVLVVHEGSAALRVSRKLT